MWRLAPGSLAPGRMEPVSYSGIQSGSSSRCQNNPSLWPRKKTSWPSPWSVLCGLNHWSLFPPRPFGWRGRCRTHSQVRQAYTGRFSRGGGDRGGTGERGVALTPGSSPCRVCDSRPRTGKEPRAGEGDRSVAWLPWVLLLVPPTPAPSIATHVSGCQNFGRKIWPG